MRSAPTTRSRRCRSAATAASTVQSSSAGWRGSGGRGCAALLASAPLAHPCAWLSGSKVVGAFPSAHPPALGWWHVRRRTVRLAVRDARPALRRGHQPGREARAPRERLPLGRGPRLLPGGPLPGVVRHPQRPDAALGRVRRSVSEFRSPRGTPTATPSIARAGWSAASTSRAASPAPRSTARSPCWPTATRASA